MDPAKLVSPHLSTYGWKLIHFPEPCVQNTQEETEVQTIQQRSF